MNHCMLFTKYIYIYLAYLFLLLGLSQKLASHAVEERKAGGRPPRFLVRAKKGLR